MRIGVLTYFKNYNHGAFMQVYALSRYMQERYPNDKVEVINYQMIKEKRFLQEHFKNEILCLSYQHIFLLLKYQGCLKSLSFSKNKIRTDSMDELGKYIDTNYDMIVVGSDEVWKTDGYRGFPTPFWLDYSFKYCCKCSFAPSSRSDIVSMNEEEKKIIIRSLSNFEFIGVRDEKTYKHLQDVSVENGNSINIVCDPTFLLTYDFDKIKAKSKIQKKWHIGDKKKIMSVILSDDDLLRKVKSVYGKEYHIISISMESDYADRNIVQLDPFEWIQFIAGSDFVLTQSFHASVFSIMSGTKFLGIDYDKEGKVSYLLSSNHLEQNLLCGNPADIRKNLLQKIKASIHSTYEKETIINTERKKAELFFNYFDDKIAKIERHPLAF